MGNMCLFFTRFLQYWSCWFICLHSSLQKGEVGNLLLESDHTSFVICFSYLVSLGQKRNWETVSGGLTMLPIKYQFTYLLISICQPSIFITSPLFQFYLPSFFFLILLFMMNPIFCLLYSKVEYNMICNNFILFQILFSAKCQISSYYVQQWNDVFLLSLWYSHTLVRWDS